MAIKQRRQPSAADVEAFGEAADQPSREAAPTPEPPTAKPAPAPTPVAERSVQASAGAWPAGLARTLTLRYPDPTIPQLLAELAMHEERSQHNTAVRALRRGLEEFKRDAGL